MGVIAFNRCFEVFRDYRGGKNSLYSLSLYSQDFAARIHE